MAGHRHLSPLEAWLLAGSALLPLAAVWLPLPHVLMTLGVPEQPLEVGARLTGQLLWFLAVYLIAVTATPYLLRLHAAHGWRVVAVLAAAAVLTDVVRFSTGVDALGYANIVFVWLAVHQLGFLYAGGRLRLPVLMAAGGFGAAVLESAQAQRLDASIVTRLTMPDSWIAQDGRSSQLAEADLDEPAIRKAILHALEGAAPVQALDAKPAHTTPSAT